MKVIPLNSNILIEVKKEEKTKSGIILAEEKRLDEAKVVAVAPDVEGIEVGDMVFFKEYSTDEITVDGKQLCFIKAENILGVKE